MSVKNQNWTYAATIYEVQKNGVTIDWDIDFNKASGAFNEASPGRVQLFRLDRATSVKKIIRVK
jgi:hypothetical protein